MIFTDLQNALVARLMGDAYFGAPETGVLAIAENRMDLLAELDQQLARCGLGVVVAIGQIASGEHGNDSVTEAIVTITSQVHEIPAINRAEGGTQKTALDVLVKHLSLWGAPWRPSDGWSPLQFTNFSLLEVDQDFGRITWQIEFQTRTFLETVVEALATESGLPLGTEAGELLINSPTVA